MPEVAMNAAAAAQTLPDGKNNKVKRKWQHVAAAAGAEEKAGEGACAIFFSFSYFAVLQEDVYKKPYGGEYFKYTFVALVAERGVNALIGYAGMLALGRSGLTIPHRDIFASGISQMFAMAGSNEALRYVSYPTQVAHNLARTLPYTSHALSL